MNGSKAPHDPGYKSIRDDGFVEIEQIPEANPQAAGIEHLRAQKLPDVRFDKEELAEMPLVIRRTTQEKRVNVWVDTDGRWWRTGGGIRIQKPLEGGTRQFVVTLYNGANESDLRFLLEWVESARQGRKLSEAWELVDADWADEMTFTLGARSRNYVDPFVNKDKTSLVFVCDESACSTSWHVQWQRHEADVIRRAGRVDYTITVCKDLFPEESEGWYVDLDGVEFYGRSEDVASLINDLEWARAECRQANETGGGAQR